eukprot:359565-Chlamydomonas_euryale.AAC.1
MKGVRVATARLQKGQVLEVWCGKGPCRRARSSTCCLLRPLTTAAVDRVHGVEGTLCDVPTYVLM